VPMLAHLQKTTSAVAAVSKDRGVAGLTAALERVRESL
jgi:hypothetical protein